MSNLFADCIVNFSKIQLSRDNYYKKIPIDFDEFTFKIMNYICTACAFEIF